MKFLGIQDNLKSNKIVNVYVHWNKSTTRSNNKIPQRARGQWFQSQNGSRVYASNLGQGAVLDGATAQGRLQKGCSTEWMIYSFICACIREKASESKKERNKQTNLVHCHSCPSCFSSTLWVESELSWSAHWLTHLLASLLFFRWFPCFGDSATINKPSRNCQTFQELSDSSKEKASETGSIYHYI